MIGSKHCVCCEPVTFNLRNGLQLPVLGSADSSVLLLSAVSILDQRRVRRSIERCSEIGRSWTRHYMDECDLLLDPCRHQRGVRDFDIIGVRCWKTQIMRDLLESRSIDQHCNFHSSSGYSSLFKVDPALVRAGSLSMRRSIHFYNHIVA